LEETLRAAICSLYMPTTTLDLAKDPFQSPVAVFQALQISTNDKKFIDIGLMDQKLNPLQFMIQLRGISYILTTAANSGVSYTSEDQSPLL